MYTYVHLNLHVCTYICIYTAVEFYEKIIKDKKFKDAKNRRVEQVMHIGNRLYKLTYVYVNMEEFCMCIDMNIHIYEYMHMLIHIHIRIFTYSFKSRIFRF
jgi:predicted RNA-binding protein with EMAP domain